MDFELPREDDPRRQQVRAWFSAHPKPTGMELAKAGYVVPHWPPHGAPRRNPSCSSSSTMN